MAAHRIAPRGDFITACEAVIKHLKISIKGSLYDVRPVATVKGAFYGEKYTLAYLFKLATAFAVGIKAYTDISDERQSYYAAALRQPVL